MLNRNHLAVLVFLLFLALLIAIAAGWLGDTQTPARGFHAPPVEKYEIAPVASAPAAGSQPVVDQRVPVAPAPTRDDSSAVHWVEVYRSLLGSTAMISKRDDVLKQLALLSDRGLARMYILKVVAMESTQQDGLIMTHHAGILLFQLEPDGMRNILECRREIYVNPNARVQQALSLSMLASLGPSPDAGLVREIGQDLAFMHSTTTDETLRFNIVNNIHNGASPDTCLEVYASSLRRDYANSAVEVLSVLQAIPATVAKYPETRNALVSLVTQRAASPDIQSEFVRLAIESLSPLGTDALRALKDSLRSGREDFVRMVDASLAATEKKQQK